MRVLVLDNRDASTPVLVKALEELEAECEVRFPDEIDLLGILDLRPRRILITPGPGAPEDSGVCRKVVQDLAGQIPILGVCLGMQVIAEVAGARILPSKKKPAAAKKTTTRKKKSPEVLVKMRHDSKGIFEALPSPLIVGHHEAQRVDGSHEPPFVEFSAWSEEDGSVLGLRLSGLGVEGVQFSPESFLTQSGNDMLFNFLYRSQIW
jgi:anthranilate synthase/aminodeoxychorismate synthase-like glutamine amidotransferase